MQPEVPATVQSHYELLEKTASACIDCHACESHCPFGVKIAERMKKTAELFGCYARCKPCRGRSCIGPPKERYLL